MTDFAPTHEEIVPPPAKVRVDFIATNEDAIGYIDVIPDARADDDSIIGYVLHGLTKERVPVRKGDALVKYEDGTLIIRRGEDVSAFYKPIVSGAPALPKKSSAKTPAEEEK
jgi:hypothetical protein